MKTIVSGFTAFIFVLVFLTGNLKKSSERPAIDPVEPTAVIQDLSRFIAVEGKKTICTMTINSSDEKNIFIRHLAKDPRFQFVEIVSAEPNWFEQACKSGIKCDMLLASGHFAGSFFGTSGAALTLSEIEKQSCSRTCNGILENAKEVFLFGCNTLADKTPDGRSTEQYLEVLREDRIPPAMALRVAESRYGGSGEDNINRMRRIFAGVPNVYGFSSKAPLGVNEGPLLEKYLKSGQPDYFSYLDRLQVVKDTKQPYTLETLNSIKNEKLLQLHADYYKALGRPNCFKQVPGIDGSDDVANRICKIRDTRQSVVSRAGHLEVLMNSSSRLAYIELCNDFFIELSKKSLTAEERSAVDRIRHNEILKTELVGLLDKVSFFLSYQYGLLAMELGVPRPTVVSVLSEKFSKSVEDGVTGEEMALINSFARNEQFAESLNLSFEQIDFDKVWNSSNAVSVVGLARPKDQRIITKLVSLLRHSEAMVRAQAAFALGHVNPHGHPSIEEGLIAALNDESSSVKFAAVTTLAQLKVVNDKVQLGLFNILNTDKDKWSRKGAMNYLLGLKSRGPAIVDQLAQSLRADADWEVRSLAATALSEMELTSEGAFRALINGLGDSNYYVKSHCEAALRKNKGKLSPLLLNEILNQFPESAKAIER